MFWTGVQNGFKGQVNYLKSSHTQLYFRDHKKYLDMNVSEKWIQELPQTHSYTHREGKHKLRNTHVFKAGNRSCCKAITIDVVTPAETFHRDSC